MSQLLIERLKRLPRRPDDAWQGALVRMPSWIAERGQPPYRPWLAVWVSLASGKIHMSRLVRPERRSFDLVLDALQKFASNAELAGYCPAELQVVDPALHAYLSSKLAAVGLPVRLREQLLTLEQVLADFASSVAKRDGGPHLDVPDPLAARCVTVDRLRAFADAAKQFYLAAPWQLLCGEDTLKVEAPGTFPDMQWLAVLGADRQVFGLGIYESEAQYQAASEGAAPETLFRDQRFISMTYGPMNELPLADADRWEDYGLPVAGEGAFPLLARYGPGRVVQRLDASELAYVEGLLRALATTSEAQVDAGRWCTTVPTADGQREYQLCLPSMLEPIDEAAPLLPEDGDFDARDLERLMINMHRLISRRQFASEREINDFLRSLHGKPIPPQPPLTPFERAQDLSYQAHRSQGRRRLKLLKHAIAVCPDCAEAYTIMGESTADVAKASEWFKQGMHAGERHLGEAFFAECGIGAWRKVEARAYLRSRLGLANCLCELGKIDEAAGHYQALLELDPLDHLGVRCQWVATLLRSGHHDDPALAMLFRRHLRDNSGRWLYCRALWTFSKQGDSVSARRHLTAGLRANPHVPRFLLAQHREPVSWQRPSTPGGLHEAQLCALLLADAWRAVPGAEAWLVARLSASRTPARRSAARQRRARRG
ncbi:MAG: hypothetical protein U1E76_26820 [Planctomycetota bacterium]